jgi:hypothetical protein
MSLTVKSIIIITIASTRLRAPPPLLPRQLGLRTCRRDAHDLITHNIDCLGPPRRATFAWGFAARRSLLCSSPQPVKQLSKSMHVSRAIWWRGSSLSSQLTVAHVLALAVCRGACLKGAVEEWRPHVRACLPGEERPPLEMKHLRRPRDTPPTPSHFRLTSVH